MGKHDKSTHDGRQFLSKAAMTRLRRDRSGASRRADPAERPAGVAANFARMPDYSRDEDFHREWDYHYLRSVHAAAATAFERAAWRPAEEAYMVLATALREHGIDPDPAAVYAGAALISRGEKPPILRPAPGRGKRSRRASETSSPSGREGHVPEQRRQTSNEFGQS